MTRTDDASPILANYEPADGGYPLGWEALTIDERIHVLRTRMGGRLETILTQWQIEEKDRRGVHIAPSSPWKIIGKWEDMDEVLDWLSKIATDPRQIFAHTYETISNKDDALKAASKELRTKPDYFKQLAVDTALEEYGYTQSRWRQPECAVWTDKKSLTKDTNCWVQSGSAYHNATGMKNAVLMVDVTMPYQIVPVMIIA